MTRCFDKRKRISELEEEIQKLRKEILMEYKCVNNIKKCSELFENTFNSGIGSFSYKCACGRVHFDAFNNYDEECRKELEELLEKEKLYPNKYILHDCSIGTIEIDGKEIVMGCDCGIAYKYEQFIINHKRQLAEYLNKYAKQLRG
jgi:hypothetical protein